MNPDGVPPNTGHNPGGVVASLRFTQGGACRATLGFETERRWRSRRAKRHALIAN